MCVCYRENVLSGACRICCSSFKCGFGLAAAFLAPVALHFSPPHAVAQERKTEMAACFSCHRGSAPPGVFIAALCAALKAVVCGDRESACRPSHLLGGPPRWNVRRTPDTGTARPTDHALGIESSLGNLAHPAKSQ